MSALSTTVSGMRTVAADISEGFFEITHNSFALLGLFMVLSIAVLGARPYLRNAGEGMMSARTSCLGPCNLGPVVQVFPEGTWYGGVDEAGVDRIIESHLLGGEVVADLAYAPLPGKQQLR